MKFFIVLTLKILLIFNLHAADIKAQLDLTINQSKFNEGELLTGYLKIWPIENANLSAFKQLQNKQITNALYVADVESVELSANNADVVEVKLLLAVKKSQEYNSAINYLGQSVRLSAPDLKIAEAQSPQDYIVLDQALLSRNALVFIILTALIAIATLIIWKRKSVIAFFKRYKSDPRADLIKKYRSLFACAATREDYERLYAGRREWQELLSIKAQAYDEFFNVMNEHQYKKEWSDNELNDVRKIFDIIRGSFK